jgi:hypothetical protein
VRRFTLIKQGFAFFCFFSAGTRPFSLSCCEDLEEADEEDLLPEGEEDLDNLLLSTTALLEREDDFSELLGIRILQSVSLLYLYLLFLCFFFTDFKAEL